MASRKLQFTTSDGKMFQVEEDVAMEWQPIKSFIEDGVVVDTVFPLTNVTSDILSMVIEYCRNHLKWSNSADPTAKRSLKAWNAEFLESISTDLTTLLRLVMAADYLHLQRLLDLTCQAVAEKIQNMPLEEIRKLFNVKNDFTPKEEAALLAELRLAFP